MPMLKMPDGSGGWKRPDNIDFGSDNVQRVYLYDHGSNSDVIVWDRMVDVAPPTGNCNIINLRSLIDANGTGSNKFTFTIDGPVGPVETGDLTGYDVTLKVTASGAISGTRAHKNALKITSPITLYNSGVIRAAGGDGGKGADSTATTYTDSTITWENGTGVYNIVPKSGYNCGTADTPTDMLNSDFVYVASYATNPKSFFMYDGYRGKKAGREGTIIYNSGKYYKTGEYMTCKDAWVDESISDAGGPGQGCHTGEHHCRIIRGSKATHNISPSFRAGGAGGKGRACDWSGSRAGATGTQSTPDGYDGGNGGTGGDWGQNGSWGSNSQDGNTSGKTAPQSSGYSIKGTSLIAQGSVTGTLKGPSASTV